MIADFFKQHLLGALTAAALTAIGGVTWFAAITYLDIRHVQRIEHKATLEAFTLERRCAQFYDRVANFTIRVENINREQTRLRNYNGRAPDPENYLVKAREDTITDLEGEKDSLSLQIGNIAPPAGCEVFQ